MSRKHGHVLPLSSLIGQSGKNSRRKLGTSNRHHLPLTPALSPSAGERGKPLPPERGRRCSLSPRRGGEGRGEGEKWWRRQKAPDGKSIAVPFAPSELRPQL